MTWTQVRASWRQVAEQRRLSGSGTAAAEPSPLSQSRRLIGHGRGSHGARTGEPISYIPDPITNQIPDLIAVLSRITDAYNCGTYELASTMLAVGLSWQQSLAAIIVGHLVLSWTITLNGTIGARLNIPFRKSEYSHIPRLRC